MLYIISKYDLAIKDIIQVSDYTIEENIGLNGNSDFVLSQNPRAVKGDFVQFKDYLGVISNIETVKQSNVFKVNTDEISALFDRRIILKNQGFILSDGIEDFVANVIYEEWTNSSDTFLNINYINVVTKTHTPMIISIENEEGIYNFRTFLVNINKLYNIGLSYSIQGSHLNISITKNNPYTFDLDLNIQDIIRYEEVYSVDVIAKVTVLSKESNSEFSYYLKSDRTITTDIADPNRVNGKVECVVCEIDLEVSQKALDTFKSNSYTHNISLSLISDSKVYEEKELTINRPLRVKTSDNGIYFTVITKKKRRMKSIITEYECGNIRVSLIDKLKGKV